MSSSTLIAGPLTKMNRAELARISVPPATPTHKPVPHHEIVEALIETLGFRQIGVVREEYAVTADGMRMFGVMDLSSGFDGCRFAIGLRNSHDKSFLSASTDWAGTGSQRPTVESLATEWAKFSAANILTFV